MMGAHLQRRGGRQANPAGPPGVVLVITLLLVGLMMVITTAMIDVSFSDYLTATNESRSVQALFNADAGMEEAKMRLSPNAPAGVKIPIGTDPKWRAYLLSGTTQAQIQGGLDPAYVAADAGQYLFYNTVQTGPAAIKFGWARIEHKFDASGNIVYQDAVTGQLTAAASQVAESNTVYNPPMLVVTAEGIQGSVRRMSIQELKPIVSTTTTTTEVVTDPFKSAAHGKSSVSLLGGAWTDSYDSGNGQYNVAGNQGNQGDVTTDGTADGVITLTGSSTVNGSVTIGPEGDPSTAISLAPGSSISGTTSVESAPRELPLSSIPTLPDGTPILTNQGPLTLAGNAVRTLTEGVYWFSSISITGSAQLRLTGAVKIYVTGQIDIGGNGIATGGNLPPNLLIYGTKDPTNPANKTTQVSIHGNGDFYGAVYAPQAAIQTSGNGAVYGALTGSSADINGNGGLHYDTALGNLGRFVTTAVTATYTTTGFGRHSWREVSY